MTPIHSSQDPRNADRNKLNLFLMLVYFLMYAIGPLVLIMRYQDKIYKDFGNTW
jgi:hypothetical protein